MPPTPTATNSQQAFQNLQSFQGQMKNPGDILTSQEQSLGVPGAQQQVSGLRQAITNTTNLLNQIPSSVYGRDANSLVTAGQAGRQIQNEQAPVSQTLQNQTRDYGNASSDLSNLLNEARTRTSLEQAGQQNQLQALQGIYSDLSAREQAQATQQLEQQKLAEQMREANLTAGSNSAYLNALTSSGSDTSANQAKAFMAPKANGGGFNFTDTNNKAISAAQYAQLSGVPIGDLLRQMGQAGDRYAQQAYNQIQQNQKYYQNNPVALKQEFAPLFWGT